MEIFSFLEGKKILIAEDEPYNQELMKDIFEDSGCHLIIVETGSEAVKKFEVDRYDIILMDAQMPVMDGYQATAEIRELEVKRSQARTPILAITGNALSGDRERCLKVGMDDYLPKPIRIHDLRTKIHDLITGSR